MYCGLFYFKSSYFEIPYDSEQPIELSPISNSTHLFWKPHASKLHQQIALYTSLEIWRLFFADKTRRIFILSVRNGGSKGWALGAHIPLP